ncbi:1,4-alpha-glucan-branching enzyme [Candidatus Fermentibacteria bacterium]|nr:1,4-alpha-glucan-branching enzyme [Candidatus Fermentibacteria bacterium]
MRRCSEDRLSALEDDPYLRPYLGEIKRRRKRIEKAERSLAPPGGSLADHACGHEYYGLHRTSEGWVLREWAPNATSIYLTGTFSDWKVSDSLVLRRINDNGDWELNLPPDLLSHGDLYRLFLRWPGGSGDRIPAYARSVVQDRSSKIFNAQVWMPPEPYRWLNDPPPRDSTAPLIYEAHVGMAQEREGVGTYREFGEEVLPRIVDAGYNVLQLMAVMEHPYYASFGYQVSSFFAASSRFGPPEDLKWLVDEAHGMGISVVMDLVHSHAAANEVEGLSRFDGTTYQYFHQGDRGYHPAWGSRCFDYGKPQVRHFLLSNCRFWLDEYRIDGFRFDGITSMLYHHRGLGVEFSSYDRYFDESVDVDAYVYLALANRLVHLLRPDAITIAEDVSGMPGLAAPVEDGGCGFDYRMAMGIPDCWFKLVNDFRDEDWNLSWLWQELNNRRPDERTISYAESHDQALVGGKSLIFEMMDADMYHHMRLSDDNLSVDRGVALHKMIRLATLATAGFGYMNFMGNEFGHPEWIDFPREGNDWSYHYARRQWHLRDDPELKYGRLADFDRVMIRLARSRHLLRDADPRLLRCEDRDKVLVFERGGLLFLFNFHPSSSYVDYPIQTPPGEYELLFDTDESRFGGHGRIEPGQRYLAEDVVSEESRNHRIRVYLPCRCALVLQRAIPEKL